jgi:hypothetical protein
LIGGFGTGLATGGGTGGAGGEERGCENEDQMTHERRYFPENRIMSDRADREPPRCMTHRARARRAPGFGCGKGGDANGIKALHTWHGTCFVRVEPVADRA